jgi:hypothetical protein
LPDGCFVRRGFAVCDCLRQRPELSVLAIKLVTAAILVFQCVGFLEFGGPPVQFFGGAMDRRCVFVDGTVPRIPSPHQSLVPFCTARLQIGELAFHVDENLGSLNDDAVVGQDRVVFRTARTVHRINDDWPAAGWIGPKVIIPLGPSDRGIR